VRAEQVGGRRITADAGGEHRRSAFASRTTGASSSGGSPATSAGAAPATHAYFHGEKVAYGLLVQLVLEGQPRSELK
jgi:hypothetical protein